jgi:hypothetical protein
MRRPKVAYAMDAFYRKTAVISPCGNFRYVLRREWDDTRPPYVSGMLNPSIADAELDDPTITRNVRRAVALGFGSLVVWNLGAGRATDPNVWKAMRDPVGPDNDEYIRQILTDCRDRGGIAVVGWGNLGSFMRRDEVVLRIASDIGITFRCLGTTKNGQPRHPLYVSLGQPLMEWKPRL